MSNEDKGKKDVTVPYDRKTATVAPDGSPLTDYQLKHPHVFRKGDIVPGRSKGTKNKRKKTLNAVDEMTAIMSQRKFKEFLNPIEVLMLLSNIQVPAAQEELGLKRNDVSPSLQASCAKSLAEFVLPKMKSIEITKAQDGEKKEKEDVSGPVIMLPQNGRESDDAVFVASDDDDE